MSNTLYLPGPGCLVDSHDDAAIADP